MAERSECSDDCVELIDQTDDRESVSDDILCLEEAGEALSNLNWSADGTCQVYLHLSLRKRKLRDISVLHSFVHLQRVELPFNNIEELSALSGMSSLLELDVSHNRITKLLDFTPPRNLKVVNMSYNCISEISDLSVHHYLQRLELDYNNITRISGLSKCHRLSYLTLGHNQICRLEGLDNLPIKFLSLSGNNIEVLENLDCLHLLKHFEIANNKLRSLHGLQHHEFLDTVDLEGNEIIDMYELRHISQLDALRALDLRRNPICELPDYRLAVIFAIQQLTMLDKTKILVADKVAARNLFNPTIEYLAARDHMMHVVYSFLQPTRLLDITLPMLESPYPMLVLVGPQGVGKKNLAQKLAEELPDYFGYGTSHTTRLPYSDEVAGKDYYFVSLDEFENGIKMGAFLQTCSYHNELYGLSLEVVEAIARESLACVVHMELEGVLTLKNSYLEPRYVLLLPATSSAHERRLLEKGVYSDEQVEQIMERTEFYAEYNRQHPGFFDTTHMSDDITETFIWLHNLVLQYLGLPQTPTKETSVFEPTMTDLSSMDHMATRMRCFSSDQKEEQQRVGSAPAAVNHRTWSRPSLTDCMDLVRSQTSAAVHRARSPWQPRGSVEAESLKRRQSVIKDAIVGRTPPLYQQILQRNADTTPIQSVPEPSNETAGSWFPAPVTCPADRDGLSGSDSESCRSEEITCTTKPSFDGSVDHVRPVRRRLLDDTVLDLTTPSTNITCHSMVLNGAQHDQPSRHSSEPVSVVHNDMTTASSATARPGSTRHPVLPPIRQLRSAEAVVSH